jgi:hypothetical protein
MAAGWLAARRERLLERQNADGGWGYVPGGRSWLEPTAYAMLALEGYQPARGALEAAWRRVRSWQRADGAWNPAEGVDAAHWTTALAVLLSAIGKRSDRAFLAGLDWLIRLEGAENRWWRRLLYRVRPETQVYDPSLAGWPWLAGTSSWVEPTALAMLALGWAAPLVDEKRRRLIRARLELAERMLLDRRATDGGWNYGNRIVLGEKLPSYPETTALALLALGSARGFDRQAGLEIARRHWQATRSRLARAWLAICFNRYASAPPAGDWPPEGMPKLTHVAALEALGAEEGNWRLFEPSQLP